MSTCNTIQLNTALKLAPPTNSRCIVAVLKCIVFMHTEFVHHTEYTYIHIKGLHRSKRDEKKR